MPRWLWIVACSLLVTVPVLGADAPADKVGKLPHVEFDVKKRQVRVECESLAVDAPLEFFVCLAGTNEHEAVLRTRAKPSHINVGLLAIGLKPGQPITFMEATRKWIPPQGPPLHLTVEYEKDGKTVSFPAYRWIRDIKTKKEPKAFTWIFAGSRVTGDGRYGADDTGYIVTLVNFDYAMIDIPDLASSSNDLLEWERNADLMPPKGTTVTLVIEPAGGPAASQPAGLPAGTQPATGQPATGQPPAGQPPAGQPPAGQPPAGQPPVGRPQAGRPQAGQPPIGPSGSATPQSASTPATQFPAFPESDVRLDEQKLQAMVDYHNQVMAPRQAALREAAEAHYKVIADLRKEQQRLITEADRIQRAIDQLEKDWADATTPRPGSE